jgi:hypothetical protein
VDADVGHVGARDVVACPPRIRQHAYSRRQQTSAYVSMHVGHVGARDVVACPPRSLRRVSIGTFVLVKRQYLYFSTSTAEEDADVGHVGARHVVSLPPAS